MKLSLVAILTISLALFFISCDEDNVTGNGVTLVKVNVDLQLGFQDHFVKVKFNDTVHFSADLTPGVSLAGPLATFITYLPHGLNQCEVFWQENYGQAYQPFHLDSTDVYVGDSKEYYMGIRVSSDTTLVVEIREEPFYYL